MEPEYTAKLVAKICQLAEGPARPVLKEAAQEWHEGFKRAVAEAPPTPVGNPSIGHQEDLKRCWQLQKLRESKFPRLPWPPDPGDMDFRKRCAAVAVFHDENCPRCKHLDPEDDKRLFPKPADDPDGGSVWWVFLREEVRKKPDPAFVRECLESVRFGLQLLGVKLPAVDRPSQGEGAGKTRAEVLRVEVSVAGGGLQAASAAPKAMATRQDKTPAAVPTQPADRTEQGEGDAAGPQKPTENEKQMTRLNELNNQTPELDEGSEDWASSQAMARLLGVPTLKLNKRRHNGVRSKDKTFGLHNRGLFWRKRGNANPCYYLPLARKHRGHLAKTFPPRSPFFAEKSP